MKIKLPEWMYRDKVSAFLHGLVTVVPGMILGFLVAPQLGFIVVNATWGFYICKELGPKGDMQEAQAKGLRDKITDSAEDILMPTVLSLCANAALWGLA